MIFKSFFIKSLLYLVFILSFTLSYSLILTAQESEPDPIILIPGIGASWNWEIMLDRGAEGVWDFLPLSDEYENLISSLEEQGYIKGQTLFIVFYDWRKTNQISATEYLIPIIDQALQNSNSGYVDIIAHSMGGIVARSYIQGNSYRGDVDQLIMIGTPNFGSSDVYSLWEGGLVPKNWDDGLKNVLGFYLWYMTTVTAQTADNYDTIHQHIPSIHDLLPTYDYLVDAQTNEIQDVDDMVVKNIFLEAIEALNNNLKELNKAVSK